MQFSGLYFTAPCFSIWDIFLIREWRVAALCPALCSNQWTSRKLITCGSAVVIEMLITSNTEHFIAETSLLLLLSVLSGSFSFRCLLHPKRLNLLVMKLLELCSFSRSYAISLMLHITNLSMKLRGVCRSLLKDSDSEQSNTNATFGFFIRAAFNCPPLSGSTVLQAVFSQENWSSCVTIVSSSQSLNYN